MLTRFIGRIKRLRASSVSMIAPDEPFVAIGDIHGRADLLTQLLAALPDYQIVCVGDYIDRGEQSAQVLRVLNARPDIVCLSGNHEEMLLDFLANPAGSAARWLRFGGLDTLASFGVACTSKIHSDQELVNFCAALKSEMGPDVIEWIGNLPTCWQSGNVAIVHAGADPAISIAKQTTESLHWGHRDFVKVRRDDGLWILHGHTIVAEPCISGARIAIDTGAYATGCLTAAVVTPGKVEFVSVGN